MLRVSLKNEEKEAFPKRLFFAILAVKRLSALKNIYMAEKKKILVVGHRGMLGQELVRVFSIDATCEVTGWDREEIDITDFSLLEERLASLQPDIVINAAAYNGVDSCEESEAENEKALVLNRDVPGKLALLSKKLHFVLVHYSSNYVFDGALEKKGSGGCGSGVCCGGGCHGSEGDGYSEEAVPNPLSRYGMTKYLGEQALQKQGEKYYLIRLSKLFGKPGDSPAAKQSFFGMMLELAKTRSELQVVDDEKSCFTYAPDLAVATKELIESASPYGIYHLVNQGSVTWFEAAQELFQQAGKSIKVIPVESGAFPRPAKRPSNATLLNTKRLPLRPYQEALREYVSLLSA